jgi:hypothetical protein
MPEGFVRASELYSPEDGYTLAWVELRTRPLATGRLEEVVSLDLAAHRSRAGSRRDSRHPRAPGWGDDRPRRSASRVPR